MHFSSEDNVYILERNTDKVEVAGSSPASAQIIK